MWLLLGYLQWQLLMWLLLWSQWQMLLGHLQAAASSPLLVMMAAYAVVAVAAAVVAVPGLKLWASGREACSKTHRSLPLGRKESWLWVHNQGLHFTFKSITHLHTVHKGKYSFFFLTYNQLTSTFWWEIIIVPTPLQCQLCQLSSVT